MFSKLLAHFLRRRACEACSLRLATSTGFCSDDCAKTFLFYDV